MDSEQKWAARKLTDKDRVERIRTAKPARESLSRIKRESFGLREHLRELNTASRRKVRELSSHPLT